MYLTFLWHMHQPYYKDPFKGEYALPWTYLHAVKDYYDMAVIVDESPGARVVFNLVPSLLEQIVDYAAGAAVDPFLIRGKMAPEDMGEEDKRFIIENFFSANRQRMIDPNRRYLELLHQADDALKGGRSVARAFGDQDLLDLQVLFFLAWTGEAAKRRYPELRELVHKGRSFSRQDKELLFARQHDILSDIIPLYRKLHETGKAELSVTPYFHPILPLLCDMKAAHTAMPRANLPASRFRHPEDARSQVEQGIAYFRELFGFTPQGMWPSEGSVSDEALSIISGCGLSWVATDEEILARTLPGGLGLRKRELYHHYSFRYGARDLKIFFRDHQLSDLIGFTYSQWETQRAVSDFIGRLRDIREHAGTGEQVVSVILDGENAWEYYPSNGYDFLTTLYSSIADCDWLKMTTFSDVLARVPEQRVLSHIHPGSWINANYGIWVGHPEENLAWDYLERAREAAVTSSEVVADLLATGPAHLSSTGQDDVPWQVCKSLYAAEGSDWFWWYGDDHFSPHSDRFDSLFRRYLINVYRLLNLETPRELFEPIKKKNPAGLVREPAALLTPTINGVTDDYFEWLAAGLYDLTKQSSAMHAAESVLQSFFYGYDRAFFYVRVDGTKYLEEILHPNDILNLHLVTGREYRIALSTGNGNGPLLAVEHGEWREVGRAQWTIARTCEASIPLDPLDLEPGARLLAFVTLVRGQEELGRWPADGAMQLTYAGPDLELDNWLI
ncbi:glycoside hydrolase family 57 protein [Geobacter sp. DSM 9736]|uniref:glycoside hydrolase family 57 protein n=1 Tax=Geobacter sp. DSM 9736 TaxID=1277350 RepID=UPI000B4FDB47|nr:glycoside hydrolase family 57 protein [Geobacter sp. DSM 9736]SNB47714.1 Alpha-amylase/alpha-mannosidase, GH57 family [Geobacter sp. DSM 9736]